jgi:hypothetical protein
LELSQALFNSNTKHHAKCPHAACLQRSNARGEGDRSGKRLRKLHDGNFYSTARSPGFEVVNKNFGTGSSLAQSCEKTAKSFSTTALVKTVQDISCQSGRE